MVEPKKPNIIDLQVGSNVRSRRMALGISQEKLADALGITFQQIQKYEKGSNRISASKLWEVAKTLSCPVEYFFKGAGETAPGVDPKDVLDSMVRTSDEQRLLRSYRKLPVRGKRAVNDMADILSVAASQFEASETA